MSHTIIFLLEPGWSIYLFIVSHYKYCSPRFLLVIGCFVDSYSFLTMFWACEVLFEYLQMIDYLFLHCYSNTLTAYILLLKQPYSWVNIISVNCSGIEVGRCVSKSTWSLHYVHTFFIMLSLLKIKYCYSDTLIAYILLK